MERPPESLKSLADRLAQAASSKDGKQVARMLRLSGLLGQGPVAPYYGARSDTPLADDVAALLQSGNVGIWEKKEENGKVYFARSKDLLKEWNFWANLGRIDAKGGKRRVVFIGESVARGYLYDPQFTPAMALEAILQAQLGQDQVEVIDLARTNLGYEVRDLAISALQLEPEAIVIFSGNNWSSSYPVGQEIAFVDAALRQDGIAGLKRFAEDQVCGRAERIINDVASACLARGVSLVWIVPEFNLGDWRDPVTNAPHLPKGRNASWINYWMDAQSALDKGDLTRASESAKKMTELDGGTCVAGLYILAECSKQAGDTESTRHYLELARDAVLWDSSRTKGPRTVTALQETMRREAFKRPDQIQLVDVPKLFREHLGGGIPDRRLFLDYCHLTTEGIQVVMAATAEGILRAWKAPAAKWNDLVRYSPRPSREVESEAAFLAAVHNAHWYQRYDLVRHYCVESVKSAAKIAEVMTRFIEIQTRRTPMLMCKAADEIAALGSPLIQHYLLRYNNQQLDQVLLDGVVTALKTVGIDATERLTALRREEHSISHSRTNLLDFYYCSAGLQPQEVMWVVRRRFEHLPKIDLLQNQESDYYKAYWRDSKFVLVAESNVAAVLNLTCRLPEAGLTDGIVSIAVNGQLQAELPIDRSWSTWNITLSPSAVRDGLNEVTVRWPTPEFPGHEVLSAVIDDLVEGIIPEFFCVFGEIHSFTACSARSQQGSPLDQNALVATVAQ